MQNAVLEDFCIQISGRDGVREPGAPGLLSGQAWPDSGMNFSTGRKVVYRYGRTSTALEK
jgi:hypothetical protein